MTDTSITVAVGTRPVSNLSTAVAAEWHPPRLADSVRQPERSGYAVILVFVLGFCMWAGFAPLAGGAVAPGIVSPDSNRKTVQHLEGGIVRELNVREGDVVVEGQPLVVLDPLQSRTQFESLSAQRLSLLARKVRLEAERSGATAVAFPPEIEGAPGADAITQSQRQIFAARRDVHRARQSVLAEKVAQFNQLINGLNAQIDSTVAQLGFIRQEATAKLKLVSQGLLPRPEALRLQRGEAELVGRQGELTADLGRVRQQIAEANLQMASADAERLSEINAEWDKAHAELGDVTERLNASRDILSRTVVTAPVAGTVINMRAKTIGGVVQRGETILEIVPSEGKLIIDAHVYPNDVHRVHPGLLANVHLLAYSSRVMPRIEGRVLSISPDRVTDTNGQQSYYLARVEVDRQKLKAEAPNAELIAGMAADVVIVAEERTLLDYLLQPFRAALRRGLHET